MYKWIGRRESWGSRVIEEEKPDVEAKSRR